MCTSPQDRADLLAGRIARIEKELVHVNEKAQNAISGIREYLEWYPTSSKGAASEAAHDIVAAYLNELNFALGQILGLGHTHRKDRAELHAIEERERTEEAAQ